MDQATRKDAAEIIFVVEDDEFVSDVYQKKLSLEGFNVILAKDGDQALRMLRERRPDLVLLDLIIPGKDGFQVLKEIREDDKLKDLKVIVMSNLSQSQDISRAKELGASEYIVKANISLDQMVTMVKKHLGLD